MFTPLIRWWAKQRSRGWKHLLPLDQMSFTLWHVSWKFPHRACREGKVQVELGWKKSPFSHTSGNNLGNLKEFRWWGCFSCPDFAAWQILVISKSLSFWLFMIFFRWQENEQEPGWEWEVALGKRPHVGFWWPTWRLASWGTQLRPLVSHFYTLPIKKARCPFGTGASTDAST